MGKFLSVLNRQINRFNIENRAVRELSKEKPTPAPKHPTTLKHLDKLLIETKVREDLLKKHSQLDENLKKVYVVTNTVPHNRRKPEQARLPSNRSSPTENELGYEEPETIPIGHLTLKQAMKILVDHQEDKKIYNVSQISSQYKLTEDDTTNLLKYFSTFKIYIPEKTSIRDGQDIKAYLKPAVAEEEKEVSGIRKIKET